MNQEKPPPAPVLGAFLGLCTVVAVLVLVGYNMVGGL